MTKGEYQRYLRSRRWRIIRAMVLTLHRRRCAMCDATATEVHHRTYERVGREWLSDLTPVCSACHRRFHGTAKRARRQRVRFNMEAA
jgi:5-methylcytosine-specific restriction endonuclease McrA